jgi:hypothetical protein
MSMAATLTLPRTYNQGWMFIGYSESTQAGYHREEYALGYMFAECAQNYVR